MAKAKVKVNYNLMIRTKASLAELMDSNECHAYLEVEEKDNIAWHIFGDCRHNFLWIVLSNVFTGEQFIECIPSKVHTPPMKMRDIELDSQDALQCEVHSKYMWDKYKDRLK